MQCTKNKGTREQQVGQRKDGLSYFTEWWEQWRTAMFLATRDPSSLKPLNCLSLQGVLTSFLCFLSPRAPPNNPLGRGPKKNGKRKPKFSESTWRDIVFQASCQGLQVRKKSDSKNCSMKEVSNTRLQTFLLGAVTESQVKLVHTKLERISVCGRENDGPQRCLCRPLQT